MYIKNAEELLNKILSKNEERPQKKRLVKDIKIFQKQKKSSNNMVVNNIKIFLKMKSKNWLSNDKK